MPVKLRIPVGLSRVLVKDRVVRNKYQTNRTVKFYGFFCVLKSLTTSGILKNYPAQIDYLCKMVKKGRSSFYSYMKACIELGLIEKAGDNLKLANWDMLFERFNLQEKRFSEFTYDEDNPIQTPEYYLVSSEIKENQYYQARNVLSQICQNPQLKAVLNAKAVDFSVIEKLQRIQIKSFVNGCGGSEATYGTIHSLNADLQRSVPRLRRAFGLKSNRSVGYLKSQLKLRGFAMVSERVLSSKERMRKDRQCYYTGWDKEAKESTWHLPDEICIVIR